MLKKILQTVSIFGLAATGLAPLAAQSAVTLEADVMVVRSVEAEGTTTVFYEEPEQVLPGDRLVFTTSFNNTGGEAADSFVITNPLPGAVALAENGDFTVSVDGGASFAALTDLTVTNEDGTTRSAELSDVTHLRWTIASVAPGQSGEVKYFAWVR